MMDETFCPVCLTFADGCRTYECGSCGCVFSEEDVDSNRCPDCHKFAAKLTDNGCPYCGSELEEAPEEVNEDDG